MERPDEIMTGEKQEHKAVQKALLAPKAPRVPPPITIHEVHRVNV